MSLLPFALPAAAAGIAYLNARHGFTYDWPMISALVSSQIHGSRLERRDQLNLYYLLESHAQSSRANKPWIIYQGKTWTYAQAYETVLRYGMWLKSKGVDKDDIVAIDFVNSDVFIWVWYGLWSIGARPAFINYNLTGKPLVHTVKTSTAKLVLVDQESKDNFNDDVLREQGLTRTDCTDKFEYSFELEESDVPRSLKKQSQTPQAAVEAGPAEKPLSTERKVEVIFFDDALVSHILTQPPTRFPDSIRSGQTRTSMAMLIYTSGTTGLPKPAYMAWGRCATGPKFAAMWLGLNDNDVLYASMPLYHSSASILGICSILSAGSTVCISRKFSHKTFWPEIRDSKATILQYVGETCRYLLSAPPSVLDPANIKYDFQGYYGNAKATNSKIIRDVKKKGDAYFRTGDLMRWDKQGRFWFVDRLGDTFRWKAENVSTAEVSEVLGKHPAVAEANVYGVQIPRHDGRAGCAAIVLKNQSATGDIAPSDAVLSSLAQHVKKQLPAFAVPIFIRVTREMQLTGTNKQQKHLLQNDGIDPTAVEKDGDVLYWLRNGTYTRFTKADLEMIESGSVKL